MTKIIDEHLSGEGTQASPYVIHDSTGLGYLSGANLGDYGVDKYYELGADIDMSSVASFTPIGTDSYAFGGHFDGKNHTITGMRIGSSSNPLSTATGLFGCVGNSAVVTTISNINFYNCSSYNSVAGCGICCGISNTSGYRFTLNNIHCYNCIVISTAQDNAGATGCIAGGLIRSSDSVISNCSVQNCHIAGVAQVAGIVGNDYQATAIQYNNCTVSKSTMYTSGYVSYGQYSYVAGISGRISSTTNSEITNCQVSDCTIIGTSYVAGVGN